MIKLSKQIDYVRTADIEACHGTQVWASTSATSLLCNGITPECTLIMYRNKLKSVACMGMTAYCGQVSKQKIKREGLQKYYNTRVFTLAQHQQYDKPCLIAPLFTSTQPFLTAKVFVKTAISKGMQEQPGETKVESTEKKR